MFSDTHLWDIGVVCNWLIASVEVGNCFFNLTWPQCTWNARTHTHDTHRYCLHKISMYSPWSNNSIDHFYYFVISCQNLEIECQICARLFRTMLRRTTWVELRRCRLVWQQAQCTLTPTQTWFIGYNPTGHASRLNEHHLDILDCMTLNRSI